MARPAILYVCRDLNAGVERAARLLLGLQQHGLPVGVIGGRSGGDEGAGISRWQRLGVDAREVAVAPGRAGAWVMAATLTPALLETAPALVIVDGDELVGPATVAATSARVPGIVAITAGPPSWMAPLERIPDGTAAVRALPDRAVVSALAARLGPLRDGVTAVDAAMRLAAAHGVAALRRVRTVDPVTRWIVSSRAGADAFAGTPAERSGRVSVIENAFGVDLEQHVVVDIDTDARREERERLGVGSARVVVGAWMDPARSIDAERRWLRTLREVVGRVPGCRVLIGGEHTRDAATAVLIGALVDQGRATLLEPAWSADALGRVCDVLWEPGGPLSAPQRVMQAAAARVPAVTLRVAGMAELIRDGETGVTLDADATPEQIAAAIAGLLERPDRLTMMGAAARQRAVRLFDEALMLRRWEREMESVLTELSGAPAPAP